MRDGKSQWKRACFNQYLMHDQGFPWLCIVANVNMFVASRECQDRIPHKVWGTMLVYNIIYNIFNILYIPHVIIVAGDFPRVKCLNKNNNNNNNNNK